MFFLDVSVKVIGQAVMWPMAKYHGSSVCRCEKLPMDLGYDLREGKSQVVILVMTQVFEKAVGGGSDCLGSSLLI